MSESPLYFLTITELAGLIREKQVSPVEVTEAMLSRIQALDGRYSSYATVMADHAMESAQRAENEIAAGRYLGPLHGVPVAVKDLCFTRGVPTMGGTPVLSGHIPDFDATVIATLASAGAVLLGKLNLTEGAMAGYHPDFPIPVNTTRPLHSYRISTARTNCSPSRGIRAATARASISSTRRARSRIIASLRYSVCSRTDRTLGSFVKKVN